MTTSDVAFDRGLDFFGDVLAHVPPDGWDRRSPCAGWTVLDVVGHLTTSIRFGIAVLNGEQPAWPQFNRPSDLIVGEPDVFWAETADIARAALATADLDRVMDTSMGKSTVATRLAFPAIDLFVHAWDVGDAIGLAVTIPDDIIEFTHHYIDPFPPERVRGPGGAFGAEVEVAVDASPTSRFVGWTGRRSVPRTAETSSADD